MFSAQQVAQEILRRYPEFLGSTDVYLRLLAISELNDETAEIVTKALEDYPDFDVGSLDRLNWPTHVQYSHGHGIFEFWALQVFRDPMERYDLMREYYNSLDDTCDFLTEIMIPVDNDKWKRLIDRIVERDWLRDRERERSQQPQCQVL